MRFLLPTSTMIALALAGCDPLAAPDYLGEPMLTVSGEVESALPDAPPAEIALAWLVSDFDTEFGFHPVAQTVPVEGQFPAGFTMRVYQPPPNAAFQGFSELHIGFGERARVAVGFVLALREGTGQDLTALRADDLLGVSDEHIIVYIENGDGLDDGYRLARPVDPNERFEASDRCFENFDDDQGDCIDGCFQCYDDCIDNNPEGDNTACFEACDPLVDGCFLECDREFSDQAAACEALAGPPATVVDETLRVRMFENASAEQVWQLIRPQDCVENARQHIDCVQGCGGDPESPCALGCREINAACGGSESVCEAVYTVQRGCFDGCISQENQCFDQCPGECDIACSEAANQCFLGCDDEFFALQDQLCFPPPAPPDPGT